MTHDPRPQGGSTTATGAPADSDKNSLTIGADGPILLHDRHFLEQMAHFNRERVPERNVHAKGSGAFGTFETTEDVSAYTKAALFQPGVEDRDAGALLDRRRRAGLPRHLARPPRLRAEVLHLRGQLRPRRQQHPGLLHPRHHEVPPLHPLPEAPRRPGPARQRHAVGLLDAQPGVGPPGHLPDGRPRHPGDVPPHAGLRLAHLHVGQRRGREVLGEVPLPQQPGRQGPHPGRRQPDRRRRLRLPPARPVRRHRARRPPVVDAQGAGHAVRGGEDLPLQPVRPDQDLAARRLPADHGRHDDARPQPGELLRRDRAGGLRAQRAGARHRLQPRQDAARPGVLVLRHPPLPDRPQLPAAPGQPAQTSRATTPTPRTARWPTTTGATSRCTPPTRTAAATATSTARWRTAGRPTARSCVRPTRCARTTTTSARPARWCARCGTTTQRDRFVENVAGHLLGGVSDAILAKAFDYWKSVDADTGKRIEEAVHAGKATGPAPGETEAEGVITEK